MRRNTALHYEADGRKISTTALPGTLTAPRGPSSLCQGGNDYAPVPEPWAGQVAPATCGFQLLTTSPEYEDMQAQSPYTGGGSLLDSCVTF